MRRLFFNCMWNILQVSEKFQPKKNRIQIFFENFFPRKPSTQVCTVKYMCILLYASVNSSKTCNYKKFQIKMEPKVCSYSDVYFTNVAADLRYNSIKFK